MVALSSFPELAPPSVPARQQQTRLTPDRIVQLVTEYQSGAAMNALAQAYGIHRNSVRAHLYKAGIAIRRRGLTEQQMDEATRLYLAGNSLARLGEQLGCDQTTVRRALSKRGVVMRFPWNGS